MNLDRRDLLLGSASAAFFLAAPDRGLAAISRLERLKPFVAPSLRLLNANNGERINCEFWRDGRFLDRELRRIDWFMRDWREDVARPMDRDLLWALATVREAAMRDGHDGEIRFLSGYRTRKTNDMLRRAGFAAVRNSLHVRAQAVDFSLPGIPVGSVSRYARWLELGGVGHYPEGFVHIDTGSPRHWNG